MWNDIISSYDICQHWIFDFIRSVYFQTCAMHRPILYYTTLGSNAFITIETINCSLFDNIWYGLIFDIIIWIFTVTPWIQLLMWKNITGNYIVPLKLFTIAFLIDCYLLHITLFAEYEICLETKKISNHWQNLKNSVIAPWIWCQN